MATQYKNLHRKKKDEPLSIEINTNIIFIYKKISLNERYLNIL